MRWLGPTTGRPGNYQRSKYFVEVRQAGVPFAKSNKGRRLLFLHFLVFAFYPFLICVACFAPQFIQLLNIPMRLSYFSADKVLLAAVFSLTLTHLHAQNPTPPPMKPEMTEFWEPEVRVSTPGTTTSYAAMTPPSDAIVLFDGKDLSKWKGSNGDAKWDVKNGVFTVKKGTGDIETKQIFEDFQLHIEWQVPADISGQGQARANSGVFMQGIYELQLLDSYNNRTYANGQAGSIYKQKPPLVNAMRKPGDWNVYDVIFTAPRFKVDGSLFSPARITVLHNGVLVQNNYELRGDTPYIGFPKYTAHGKGPIKLQDHGDPSKPLSFRNIWIREL